MGGRLRTALVAACFAALFFAPSAEAAFPGKNGKIAFSIKVSGPGDWEVFSMNPDGSALSNLTNSPGFEYAPAWSPDGTKIAFTRGFPDGNIWVMNSDGTGQQRLTNDVGTYNLYPAWSPDGTKIAFSSGPERGFHIYAMGSDGTGPVRVGDRPGYVDFSPSWSPDGTKIAFNRSDGSHPPDIWVMDADGTGQIDLTSAHATTPLLGENAPDWSPDGRSIVYWGNDGTRNQIFAMDSNGTNARKLTSSGNTGNAWATWSPDGKMIAFDSYRDDPAGGNVFVMDTDGGRQTSIGTLPSRENVGPLSWQPIPGPKRGDYKNAAKFCEAERDFWDDQFASRYGGGANAYGKCVSESK